MQPVQRIKEAMASTVQRIKQGDDPTSALFKTAEEYDLNENYIQRVGEGLNVALSFHHFKKASAKDTDFPIADIPEVIKKRASVDTTVREKAAAIDRGVLEELPDYNRLLDSRAHKEAYVKIAASTQDMPALSVTGLYDKVAKQLNQVNAEVDKLFEDKVAAEHAYKAQFVAIASNFSKQADYRAPFHQVETQVLNQRGAEAQPFLDAVYKLAGLTEDRGVVDPTLKYASNLCKEAQHMLDLLDKVASFQKLSQDYEAALELQKTAKEAAKAATGTLIEKAAFFGTDKILDHLTGSAVDGLITQKKDPPVPIDAKDGRLANIERKMILQELLATDPIISKAPRQKVLSAYEQIVRLAPQVSREREVVRALLRQMVNSSALEPFVGNQLTEFDIKMMERRMKQEGRITK